MIDRAWEGAVDAAVRVASLLARGLDPHCRGCLVFEAFKGKRFAHHRPECARGQEEARQWAEWRAKHEAEHRRRSEGALRGWQARRDRRKSER